jgi:hypothetical protein
VFELQEQRGQGKALLLLTKGRRRNNWMKELRPGTDEDITSVDTTSPIHWSWSLTYFWTAGKHLLATVVMASNGFQFGSSTTSSESVTINDFIQRCILSTMSLFLYAFIDDSENRLETNNVMMIRNY